jgi:hypothetical protein
MDGQKARVKVLGTFYDYANVPINIKKVKLSPTNAMNTYRGQRYSSIHSYPRYNIYQG